MTQKGVPLSDLPDFLQNSPYLPILSEEYERLSKAQLPSKTQYTTPSIKQILRETRRWRNTIVIVVVIYLLYKVDWQTLRHGPSCLSYPPVRPVSLLDGGVDWSKYAYAQYVTDTEYLCNSVMFFEALHRLGSRADRLMMYPSKFSITSNSSIESRLLLKAKEEYGVKLVPVDVQHKSGEYFKWADSLTKLLIFNQTKYKRILLLDSDSTILRTMDELFFLPSQPAVMPRAYWLDRPFLSSHIMLLEPSIFEFKRVQKAIKDAVYGEYDMEIMNKLYGRRKDCMVLPHRQYALLSGEFRSKHHGQYMGKYDWDPRTVFEEAKLVHFSDDPLEKPWKATLDQVKKYQPACENAGVSAKDCQARDIWLGMYADYRTREKRVCGLEQLGAGVTMGA